MEGKLSRRETERALPRRASVIARAQKCREFEVYAWPPCLRRSPRPHDPRSPGDALRLSTLRERSCGLRGHGCRERLFVCERLATRIPGVQVAVAVNGKLVWSEGFGYADAARMRPVTHETQFRIGSVSKPFTATSVALLRSEEHTSELQSQSNLVCRLLLEK